MALRFNETSLRQLKIFKAVVECGGFSAAQAYLNTSAATISVQMKELEFHLGLTLCQRGRMGFRLTEQGKVVFDAVNNLHISFNDFNLRVTQMKEELVGQISIGIQDNLATNQQFKLPEAIAQFNKKENKVIFSIEESKVADQEIHTLNGRYNLAIGIFTHRIPGLDYKKLFTEEVNLYCAKSHPLFTTTDKKVILSELQKCKLITGGPMKVALHKSIKFNQEESIITENADATVLMILSGIYVGFVATHFAEAWVNKGLLKPLLPKEMETRIDFHMITRTGLNQSLVVDTFINNILQCHEDLK
jgi:DNA-binding transcriptional LysR family regulator